MLRREKIEHENATTQINSWYYQGFKIVRMDRIKRRRMDSALAFANGLHPTSGAAALSYATVYPLAMFLRIMSPQILAVLFGVSRMPLP